MRNVWRHNEVIHILQFFVTMMSKIADVSKTVEAW